MVGDPLRDLVRGHHIPDDLLLVSAPGQIAVRPHDRAEGLGMVRRVQGNKSHFSQIHALLDLLHQLVVHFAVRHVPPPNQHVDLLQTLVGKPLIGVVQCRQGHLHVLVDVQNVLEIGVQTVGIERLDLILSLFMTKFVPDYNVQLFHNILPVKSNISLRIL